MTEQELKAKYRLSERVCPECYGEGTKLGYRPFLDYSCPACQGTGKAKPVIMVRRLTEVLKKLYDDADSVPDDDNHRCTGLDWFSEGIKDNVVRHIGNKVLGEEATKELLDS